MLTSYIKKSHWLYLLIILLFSILGMKALFHPGLFTAHDIWHQVARIYSYKEAFDDGQFPPYWINRMANGYGYPLLFFSYHLPWIIALPILKLGVDIPTTIKTLFFLSFFLSGITMYFFVNTTFRNRVFTNRFAGLISAILYMWAPYHFLSIFVSAAMGVAFSFIFPPLLFLGIHLIKQRRRSQSGIILISIGVAGLILSHAQALFAILPATLIFSLNHFNKVFLKKLFIGLILGSLLSAFYFLPALFYNHFTQSQTQGGFSKLYERNFINLSQLVYSKWGYGPIINNAKAGEISFQIGITQWLATVGVFTLLVFKQIRLENKKITICIILAFVLSIFMMLDLSSPVWKFLTKFISLDYPTRFMLPVTFLASTLAGIFLSNLKNKTWQIVALIILTTITIYTNRNHVRVNLYTEIPISLYVASEMTTNTYNEYLPIHADPKLLNEPHMVVEPTTLKVSNFEQNTKLMSLSLSVPKFMSVSLGQFSFPGQAVYIDGKKTDFKTDDRGRINLEVPAGIHKILVKFEKTTLIQSSIALTFLGFFIILLMLSKKLNFD